MAKFFHEEIYDATPEEVMNFSCPYCGYIGELPEFADDEGLGLDIFICPDCGEVLEYSDFI